MTEHLEISPSGPLHGEIRVPGDKSISHRAVMFSALAEGRSVIRAILHAEDVLHTRAAFEAMGVSINDQGEDLVVDGVGLQGLRASSLPLDMGNAGTAMRLMAGILAGQPFESVLIGDRSLCSRPMLRIMEPLRAMGAKIQGAENDTAPLVIQGGPLKAIRYQSPMASAQVKSCVLLAGLYAEGRTTVIEPAPTRDHTERMLRAFGAQVEVDGRTVTVAGRPRLRPQNIEVPGDFSSAAFFIVAGLVVPGSEVLIRRVGVNPTRTGLLGILKRMGAQIALSNEREISGEPAADIQVRHQPLRGVIVEGDEVVRAIDEFPILSIAAAVAEGRTEFRDAVELRRKESDRIKSMAEALCRMGAGVKERPDGMIIEGHADLHGAPCESYGDHRVAMSCLIAGLIARGRTRVNDTASIQTSFPNFSKYLTQLLG